MSFRDQQSNSRQSMDEALNMSGSSENMRRRPSNAYGTHEGDSLLRYAPYAEAPEVQFTRRRVAWYKQPQKLIMVATLAWIGGIMYLANLAHAILRSQKQSSPMGSTSKDKVNVRFGMENYADKDGDYKQWLEDRKGYGMENYAEKDADYKQWLENSKGYGMENYAEKDQDFKDWLENAKYQKSNSKDTVNVRFGKERALNNDANYQEWLQYQDNNKKVKYEANGQYGKAQSVATLGQANAAEVPVPEALLDPSVSTIDWPLKMGMPSPSCTSYNGCSPSNNVTILVVYGPEYHTHISEMAWNVATGVVSFCCSTIYLVFVLKCTLLTNIFVFSFSILLSSHTLNTTPTAPCTVILSTDIPATSPSWMSRMPMQSS